MKTCPNTHCAHAYQNLHIDPDGDGQFTGGFHQWQVHCYCGMKGPSMDTEELAEQAWDDLPRDPETEKKHKEVRAKFEALVMERQFKGGK